MHKVILRTCCLALCVAAGLTLAVKLTDAAPSPPNLQRVLDVQRELAAQHPGDADTLNDLGNLLLLAGRLSEAEIAYRRAIELEPTHANYHYNLALLLDRRQDSLGARKALEEAVRLDPEHAWAFYQLGKLLHEQGLVKAAVKAYAEALYLNPDLASSRVNPHVIENQLLTEAMLLAYRKTANQPLAPRNYEDPARIAELMIQLQFTDDEDVSVTPASAASGTERRDRPRSTMALDGSESDDEGFDERGPVTVDSGDARSGSASSSGSGVGAVVVGGGGGDEGGTSSQRVRGQDGSTTRSLRTEPNADRSTPSALRPPRGTRYVPRSTGSLELQLLPGPGAKPGADRET